MLMYRNVDIKNESVIVNQMKQLPALAEAHF